MCRRTALPGALVVIIQRYGETDVAGRTSYYDLRSHFTQLGLTTVIWDKPGCGKSEGKFDADQPVDRSAGGVLDAIRHLRESHEASFSRAQAQFLSGAFQIDKKTWLQIYVPHFQDMLARLNLPVLAIFGEKDRNVDWRRTTVLYSRTIGENPHASLTVRTFPDGNHNLQQAVTGGLREMIEMKDRRMCDGYFEAMESWLRTKVPG